jgi:hypothetical protein
MNDPTTTIDTDWTSKVCARLIDVWLEQACMRPADRPETLERLLAMYGPRVDDAVTELARLFADGALDDPALAIWRAFPLLDREHCSRLATLLRESRNDH